MITGLRCQGEALFATLPGPEVPEVARADAMLRRDFRASFGISQGFVTAHRKIFTATAGIYSQLWTQEGMQRVLPEALESAEAAVMRLRLPSNHPEIDKDEVVAETGKRWQEFSGILNKRADQGPMSPTSFMHTADRAGTWISLWDIRHMARGRRPRDARVDLRESHYREHVLEGNPTGSDTMDLICRAMRVARASSVSGVWALSQKAFWEIYHPGEAFYSEKFMSEMVDDSQLRSANFWLSGQINNLAVRPLCLIQAAAVNRQVAEQEAKEKTKEL